MHAESIQYIKFTTISPEQIKKMSVARLIVPDTYNDEGYPIDSGLIDQRLGVIDPGLRCKTCGGRIKTCPGHFGHIELVRPVIHPEFAKTIYSLLQSTCHECHRILATPKEAANVKEEVVKILTSEETEKATVLSTIEEEVGKGKIRKPKSVKKCPHCGSLQRKIKLERPTFFYIDTNKMKADEIRDWLSKISDDDIRLLGMDPSATRPEWFVITVLLVPPVNVRPSITLESGERSEDDLTHKLVDIMRINQRLEQDIDAGAPQIIIDDLWELLQYQVTTYFNNETPGIPVARHRSTRPLKTLAQRLKGKEGRLRYNLSGKRVNFSARTVISPDASLMINQVGVPRKIAEVLTIPLYATKWNIDAVKKYLENKEYPTVLNVITKEGIRKRVTDVTREELIKLVEPGYILERQMIDGDIGLMNRQPTLHKLSIMAHTIKVIPGRTMRIHVSACTPYNADFDGDEMNLHVPQSLEAQAEARYLMQPKDLILSPRDGEPIMALQEDELIGMFMLTRPDSKFTKREACSMLAAVGVSNLPSAEGKGMYSGKAIFSMLLPKDFSYEGKFGGEKVIIKKGELEEGTITVKLVGEGNGALIIKVMEQYGSDFTNQFILNLSKLAVAVSSMMGATVSVKDYYNSDQVNKEMATIVQNIKTKAEDLHKKYKEKKLEQLPGYTKKETFEIEVMAELESARTLAANVLRKYVGSDNNTMLMASVKARGNILNFVQTSMLLGQQAVRGRRPQRGYRNRVLPYFARRDNSPEAKGFITSSFFTGLKPIEFFMHAMGSRDSAMSKSLVIAQSGYLQRRLINAMQDFYIGDDSSVRDASGSLIETIYGGDGVDPSKEKLESTAAKGQPDSRLMAVGEAVGTLAAQSIGEPSTQMMLKAFHSAGISSVITTRGLPRVIELIDARKRPRNPGMVIKFEKKAEKDYEKAREIWRKLEDVKLSALMTGFDENLRSGTLTIHLDPEKLTNYEITGRTIAAKLGKREDITTEQSEKDIIVKIKKKEGGIKATRTIFVNVLNYSIIGIPGINKAVIQQDEDGTFYITTSGSNIAEAMKLEGIRKDDIYSNDPFEVLKNYGVEAARNTIAHELISTIKEEGLTVSYRHIGLVADAMTLTGEIKSAGRHGIAGEKESVLARAAYEETVKHFINAGVFGETDRLTGVAENILIGKQIGVGTGRIKLGVKKEDIKKLK